MPKVTKECIACGSKFEHQTSKNAGKFCSRECYINNASMSKPSTVFNIGIVPWNKGVPMKEETLEKLREASVGQVPWNKGISYKSSGSFVNGHKPYLKGETHWNWKGGVTKEMNKLRSSSTWKQWREQVFERDNYTCQHCDDKGVVLHPHHMVPKSVNIDRIFQVNNGVTLCVPCHKETHGWRF